MILLLQLKQFNLIPFFENTFDINNTQIKLLTSIITLDCSQKTKKCFEINNTIIIATKFKHYSVILFVTQ